MITFDNHEIFSGIFYFLLIIMIGWGIKSRNQIKHPEYKYFLKGLILKLLGVLAVCLVYLYYYKGGDTINYFLGAKSVLNLMYSNFNAGIEVLFNTDSPLNSWDSFNNIKGKPPHYMWRDPNTFSVCRFSSILLIIGNSSFLATSFLTAVFSYVGIWKLYRLFNDLYLGNSRQLAYLILFIPTLLFWGGGIMKDSYVLGATCWITFNFYQVFILRKKMFWNIFFMIINLFIILNTKAYVVMSLFQGCYYG